MVASQRRKHRPERAILGRQARALLPLVGVQTGDKVERVDAMRSIADG
jgi:hypothetical protein